MGPPIFYVVRIDQDNFNFVVPDLWLVDGDECLFPASKLEDKAKNRQFKATWPKVGPVKMLSAHRKYSSGVENGLNCKCVSDISMIVISHALFLS